MDNLLASWPITGPWNVRPQPGGINNHTYRVETPDGQYILRIYGATRDLAKIRYELAIMAGVGRQSLSFAVPAPVPSRSGDPIVITEGGAPAILAPVIPGVQAERGDLSQSYPIGQALGELTRALGELKIEAPPGWRRTYGDLQPLPNLDPLSVPPQAPVPPESQARLARLVCDVREQAPAVYATLPRQTIHGDFVPFNVLMEGGRVSGVLDFEIARHDLRALDMAMALAAAGTSRWNTGAEWEALEPFCRGYFSRMQLLPEEIAALPFLIRLRRCVTFLHMTGRYLRGDAPLEVAQQGAENALVVVDWLERNGSALVDRIRGWM